MQETSNNNQKGTDSSSTATTTTTTTTTITETTPQRPNPANTDSGERRDYNPTEKKERR